MRLFHVRALPLLAMAVLATITSCSMSPVFAHAQPPTSAYAYVGVAGPFVGTPSPSRIHQYELPPGGGLKLIATTPTTGPVAAVARTLGFLYVNQTQQNFRVFRIEASGALTDTGQTTGASPSGSRNIALALRESGPAGSNFAYVLRIEDSSGAQSIEQFSVDSSTGLFTPLATLPAVNDAGALEFFGYLLVSPAASMVYASSDVSIGQFRIGSDGLLSQTETLPISGADHTNRCNLLQPSSLSPTIFGVTVLQTQGGHHPSCAPSDNPFATLLTFVRDVFNNDLLSPAGNMPLPLTNAESAAENAATHLRFNTLSFDVFASEIGRTPMNSTCNSQGQDWPIFSGRGSQNLHAIRAASQVTGSNEVNQWTEPTTTTCPTAPACAALKQDGEGPGGGFGVVLGVCGDFLLVGNPGRVTTQVNPSFTCVSNRVAPVTASPSLRQYLIGADGLLTDPSPAPPNPLPISLQLADNQVAMGIHFFGCPDEAFSIPRIPEISAPGLINAPLNPIFLSDPDNPVVRLDLPFKLPVLTSPLNPPGEPMEIRIGGDYSAPLPAGCFAADPTNPARFVCTVTTSAGSLRVTITVLGGNQYQLQALLFGPVPLTLPDPVSIVLTISGLSGNAVAPLRLQTFVDVSLIHPLSLWIEALARAGVTGGCGSNPPMYCSDLGVTRGQMAVFLLRGIHGPSFIPPAPSGVFADVPPAHPFIAWIEQLFAEGITGGCGTGPLVYCPADQVTRGQMAVFLLRSKHGAGYQPPEATGLFADVPLTHPFVRWIEQLSHEGISGGCGANPARYCPDTPVTRGQMAVFLDRAFGLPL